MTRRTRSQAGEGGASGTLADGLLNSTQAASAPAAPLPPLKPLQSPPAAEPPTTGDVLASAAAGTAKPGVPLFASANAGVAGLAPDVAKIVEAVYAVNAWADYEDLEANLEVGDQRGDYRTLTEHLDKAERRARRAHALYLGAKLELVKWELDADTVRARMRQQATDALENEKEKGERTKRITNDDIDAQIADMFGDEVRGQKLAQAKLKGTVEHLETLAALWKTKCYSLATLLGNLRK